MANYDPTSRRPEPARLVLLDQVRQQEPGTKIRALGCVHAYHHQSATLVLQLDFPSKHSNVSTVLANIDNVLDTVNHDLLQTGAWLNIVGYVRKPAKARTVPSSTNSQRSGRRSRRVTPLVDVLLIWSAGAVKLDDYQSAVRSYQDTASASTST
ncbi:putative CST complex subunit Ten1, fungal protein [Septoria linicola]|nr:putative CST complex subunit Ten1, fungal protein [Septoria linicola]